MRYAEGGGLTAQGRARREDVRLQAARLFGQGVDADQIATTLRVSAKSVYQWRRAQRSGGDAALASTGPGNLAAGTVSQLVTAMRHQVDRIQRQHSLITGFLGQT